MTLPRWAYQDPAMIVENMENRSCKGCIHKVKLWGMDMCKKEKWSGSKNEKRCKEYDGNKQS